MRLGGGSGFGHARFTGDLPPICKHHDLDVFLTNTKVRPFAFSRMKISTLSQCQDLAFKHR